MSDPIEIVGAVAEAVVEIDPVEVVGATVEVAGELFESALDILGF